MYGEQTVKTHLMCDRIEDIDQAAHVFNGEDRVKHLALSPMVFAFQTLAIISDVSASSAHTYQVYSVNWCRIQLCLN